MNGLITGGGSSGENIGTYLGHAASQSLGLYACVCKFKDGTVKTAYNDFAGGHGSSISGVCSVSYSGISVKCDGFERLSGGKWIPVAKGGWIGGGNGAVIVFRWK